MAAAHPGHPLYPEALHIPRQGLQFMGELAFEALFAHQPPERGQYRMRYVKILNALILSATASLLLAGPAYACNAPLNTEHPTVKTRHGTVFFDLVTKEYPDGTNPPATILSANYIDCTSKAVSHLGLLPFLTATGEIEDAFIDNTAGDERLFIIHSVPISTYTGLVYLSDYYRVIVYRWATDKFVEDQKAYAYFGNGADIASSADELDNLIYQYPYKTKSEVLSQLKTAFYNTWINGGAIHSTINKRSALYELATPALPTGNYVERGTPVLIEKIRAGWLSIAYTTENETIRGWLLCESVEGCK